MSGDLSDPLGLLITHVRGVLCFETEIAESAPSLSHLTLPDTRCVFVHWPPEEGRAALLGRDGS